MNEKLLKFFFRRKPVLLLLALNKEKSKSKEYYSSQLAKDIDSSYSHVVSMMVKLKDLDFIDFKKNGRIKEIKLTDKGKRVANLLLEVLK